MSKPCAAGVAAIVIIAGLLAAALWCCARTGSEARYLRTEINRTLLQIGSGVPHQPWRVDSGGPDNYVASIPWDFERLDGFVPTLGVPWQASRVLDISVFTCGEWRVNIHPPVGADFKESVTIQDYTYNLLGLRPDMQPILDRYADAETADRLAWRNELVNSVRQMPSQSSGTSFVLIDHLVRLRLLKRFEYDYHISLVGQAGRADLAYWIHKFPEEGARVSILFWSTECRIEQFVDLIGPTEEDSLSAAVQLVRRMAVD